MSSTKLTSSSSWSGGTSHPSENIEVRFPFAQADRTIAPFSVGYDDGMCKAIIMMAIVAFVKELEIDMSRDDGSLKMVLSSFRSIRCSYIHFENPHRDHFLHSLRTLPHVDITFLFLYFPTSDFCPGLVIIHESYLRNTMGHSGETKFHHRSRWWQTSNQPSSLRRRWPGLGDGRPWKTFSERLWQNIIACAPIGGTESTRIDGLWSTICHLPALSHMTKWTDLI